MSKEILINPGTSSEKKISIPVSSVDDIDTIKYRVAADIGVPYYFLKIIDNATTLEEKNIDIGIPFKSAKKKIVVSNIENMDIAFTTVQSLITKNKSMESLDQTITEFFKTYNFDVKFSVFIIFYYLFKKTKDSDFLISASGNLYRENMDLIFTIIPYIEKKFGTLISFNREYNQFVKKIETDTNDTKSKNKSNMEFINMVKENEKNVKKIKIQFSKDRIKFVNSKIVLSPFDIDELELLNNLSLSRDVPFANIGGFSKTLKSFIPPDEFLKISDSRLTLFVFNKKNELSTSVINPLHYSTIKIVKNNNTLEILIESKIEGIDKNTDVIEEVIIQRIINALNVNVKNLNLELLPEYFKGEFYFPHHLISRIAIHDIVMLNKFISKMFVINEQFTTFNKKGGVTMLYAPGDTKNKSEISAVSLSNGIVTSANKRFIRSTILKLGDTFVTVAFKTKNNYTLNIIRECMSHLFSVYFNDEKEILKSYEKINCNYKEDSKVIDRFERLEQKKEAKKKLKLKDYLPDLFVTNYPASCGKPPEIIEDEDEAEARIKKGEDIMKYPLNEEFDQYYYSCSHHKDGYIHPGLKKTNFTQDLVPCCYSISQKTNSLREKYEKGKLEDDDEKKAGTKFKIYKTTKIMPIPGLGYLAPKVEKLFSIIDPEFKYLRSGVFVGVNSCIEAILRAKTDKNFDIMDKEDREELLSDYRNKLKDLILKGASSQNSYLYSSSSLINIIEQENKFIDVKLFHDALQELFQIHLVLFQVTKENTDGELVSPYYINNLYLLNQKRDYRYTVILYETMGTRIDNLQFPHYELICKLKEDIKLKENIKLISRFDAENITTERLSKAFDDMFMRFSEQLHTRVIENPFVTPIKSQKADTFGKIRLVKFTDGINILIQPMDSLPMSLVKSSSYFSEFIPNDNIKKVMDFLSKENIKDYKYVIVQNKAVGIITKKADVSFYIALTPTSKYDKTKVSYDTKAPSFILKEDILVSYAKREKSARLLLALSLYLFSVFINTFNKSISDDNLNQTIVDFTNDIITVNSDIDEDSYFNIERKFMDNDQIKNNKLVLNSMNLVKKIMYNLFIKTRQNSNYVKNYSSFIYIPDYYKDVRDFKKDEDCIYFNSAVSLMKWKKSVQTFKESKVYSEINDEFITTLEKEKVCLFTHNKITNNELYVALKASSIDSACAFFNKLKEAGSVDIKLASSSDYNNSKVCNKFKGRLVTVNDQTLDDISVKTYGEDESNILLMFKNEDKTYLLCLFKYKL